MTDTPPPPPGASAPPPPPPPAATPPVAPPAPAAPEAKKRSPLLWIAVGCAALVVVALLMMVGGGLFLAKKGADFIEEFSDDPAAAAMVVAENVVRINPDLELVDSDRETQTITVRNKDTGEVMSLSLEDIESGHIEFESDEGEVSLDLTQADEGGALTVTRDGEETFRFGIDDAGELPDWIPIYAGSEVEGIFSMVADGATNGAFTLQSDDSVKEVLDYYAGQFEDQDWDVSRSDFSSGDTQGGQLSIENEELGRGLTITATSRDQGTQAAVNYRFRE